MTNKEESFQPQKKSVNKNQNIEVSSSTDENNNTFTNNSPHFLTKIENCVEIIFMNFSKWVHFIGPFFVLAMFMFYFISIITFTKVVIPYWSSLPRSFLSFIMLVLLCPLFIVEYCYTIFNYIMVVLVKPGTIQDIKNSKKFKKKSPYYCSSADLTPIINESNYKQQDYNFPQCTYCHEIKPLRVHHCSICNLCILKMDHHCPWINNCVGLNNYRYFVLFLFHLLVLCIINSVLSVPTFFLPIHKKTPSEFKFVTILTVTGIFLLIFFNSWYWYMIINNDTSIDFWLRRMMKNNLMIKSYSLGSIKENLLISFGESNFLKCLFIPSISSLEISGLEYSKLIDKDFYIKGILDKNEDYPLKQKIIDNDIEEEDVELNIDIGKSNIYKDI